MNNYPLLIEFVPGTCISRDPAFVELVSTLPIVQNGPPGTSIVFKDGAKVPCQLIRSSWLRTAAALLVWVSAE